MNDTPTYSPQDPITPEVWQEECNKMQGLIDELSVLLREMYGEEYLDTYDQILKAIIKNESEDTLSQYAVYHILVGGTPPPETPYIDLGGSSSIMEQLETYISVIKNNSREVITNLLTNWDVEYKKAQGLAEELASKLDEYLGEDEGGDLYGDIEIKITDYFASNDETSKTFRKCAAYQAFIRSGVNIGNSPDIDFPGNLSMVKYMEKCIEIIESGDNVKERIDCLLPG